MNETEQTRSYLKEQIKINKSKLNHYLKLRSEAMIEITKLTETLKMLERTLSYLKGSVPDEKV